MQDTDTRPADASSAFADSLPTRPEMLYRQLDDLGIRFTEHHHPPLRTVEDSQALRGSLEGAHIKNLYLRDRKKNNYLVVAEETMPVDLKTLGGGLDGARLSFGSPERLMQFLGVRPGAVTPLSLINDTERQVRLIIDAQLLEAVLINVHPLVNDRTLTLATADLLRFFQHTGHIYSILQDLS